MICYPLLQKKLINASINYYVYQNVNCEKMYEIKIQKRAALRLY